MPTSSARLQPALATMADLVKAVASALDEQEYYWMPTTADVARAALAAIEAAGWRVVPAEPTRDMIDAAFRQIMHAPKGTKDGEAMAIFYKAMLAAAPPPEGRT